MNRIVTANKDCLMLVILSKKNNKTRILGRAPVLKSDLALARDETWWQGLRAGILPDDISALSMKVLPGENRGHDRLDGFSIAMTDGEQSYCRRYSHTCLSSTVLRLYQRLEKENVIESLDSCFYYLTAAPAKAVKKEEKSAMNVKRRPNPLPITSASLEKYMDASEPMLSRPENQEGVMPVFVTEEVWDQGRRLARRGGQKESAAIITGRVMRDTASPELFLVLDAFIEAENSADNDYTVVFSGDAWAKVRAALETRRRRLKKPHEIILGSVHGHNFKPGAANDEQRKCLSCDQRETCTQTTAFASASDLKWHCIHFSGQPWALLIVWGWTPRDQEEWRMYGLKGASMAPRGLRKLTSDL